MKPPGYAYCSLGAERIAVRLDFFGRSIYSQYDLMEDPGTGLPVCNTILLIHGRQHGNETQPGHELTLSQALSKKSYTSPFTLFATSKSAFAPFFAVIR
jgi:hypothetical protein